MRSKFIINEVPNSKEECPLWSIKCDKLQYCWCDCNSKFNFEKCPYCCMK